DAAGHAHATTVAVAGMDVVAGGLPGRRPGWGTAVAAGIARTGAASGRAVRDRRAGPAMALAARAQPPTAPGLVLRRAGAACGRGRRPAATPRRDQAGTRSRRAGAGHRPAGDAAWQSTVALTHPVL